MTNPTAQLLQHCRELSETTGARVLVRFAPLRFTRAIANAHRPQCIVITGGDETRTTAVHNSLAAALPLTIEQDGGGGVCVASSKRPAYASVCTAPAKPPPPSAPPALLTSLFTRLESRPLFGPNASQQPIEPTPEFPFECHSREHSQEEIVAIHALAELSPE